MTLLELQDNLSKSIDDINQTVGKKGPEVEAAYRRAEFIAKVSKQMINNADIILRADKLGGRHDRIDIITGEHHAK